MSQQNIYRSGVSGDSLSDDDKIAIVGIGCRYGDGVAGPREMWSMLKEMRDCTTSHPAERFDKSSFFYPGDKKKGKLYTKRGGYLKQDPFKFDRQFFKMSPVEAEHMDPQIRILLEVVWESIEDAGIPASTFRGSNTGVYMGVTANEYFALTGLPLSNISQYTNSGTNSCMISNRISYEFDLRGPSFSIDTACSSSLYAVQLACDALRTGVCSTAIAGGVNIILTPSVTIGFCQAGMLSPDGQCKSFDESADGYSRSEGVGSVILKPLKTAIADRDRIYAVIRGGSLTNDGRTPGIANPSFDAQIDLVYRACTAAKVDPCDIAYIEAHGTGTKVGDKTEANAIGEVMSKKRSDDMPPLYIGSIKSNVGHAEGAAGIAGVIKTALSLYHREIPGVVHFNRGNPNINFEDLNLRVPSTSIPWPSGSNLLAGCSSFGFGGANAHVVFEAAPSDQQCTKQTDSLESYNLLMISANSPKALEQRYVDWKKFLSFDFNDSAFKNVLYTASLRSHNHAERAVFLAKSRNEFRSILQQKVQGSRVDTVIEGKVQEGNSVIRTVFVFSGMGTQWWGMARDLMNTQPIFFKVIQLIDGYLWKCGGRWSLIQMLSEETDQNRINSNTEISQVCICSVQIGLVELYKHYGVTPSAIIGHSVGEVAAAYAAGLITIETAVKIIYKRGRLLRKTSGSGTMVAVLHDVEVVKNKLKTTTDITYLDIAAINSPTQIVLSGKTELINDFSIRLKEDGIQTKILKVNNAFHSRQQEVLKKEFFKKTSFLTKKKSLGKLSRPLIPMLSTVTNRYLTLQEANTPDYWWGNIRRQVRFKDAVNTILKDRYNSFVEIGAHPALSPAIKDIIASTPSEPTIHFVTHSLKRPRDVSTTTNDSLNFNISLAEMFVSGYPVDMTPKFQDFNCEVESLPLYPWQRIECSAATPSRNEVMRYPNAFHPLLGKPDTSANFSKNGVQVWKASIGSNEEPWIADHVVQGSVVFPAAGFIETAFAAHHSLFSESYHVIIKDVRFDRFMFVSDKNTDIETTTEMTARDTAAFRFCSLSNKTENNWTKHTEMTLINNGYQNDPRQDLHLLTEQSLHVTDIKERCLFELDKSAFYVFKHQVGFNLGKSFMCVEKVNHNKTAAEALIYLRAPETVAAQSSRFYVHPAFLDGILQGMAGLERLRGKILNPTMKPQGRVPRSIERLCFKKCTFPENVYLHFKISDDGDDMYSDVTVANADTFEVIGKCSKIRFGSVNGRESNTMKLWTKKWVPIDVEKQSFDTDGFVLIAGNDSELSLQIQNTLNSVGFQSQVYTGGDVETDQLRNEQPLNCIITIKPGNCESLRPISRDTFLEQQSDIAEMCISYFKVISNLKNVNTKVWLITRDGFSVTQDDIVDPYQASAYGFGICVIQEHLDFDLSILDISSDVTNTTASDWLMKYIWGSDNYEQIIALRAKATNFNAYAFRLCISDSYTFSHTKSTDVWKFNVPESLQSGRLSLTKYSEKKGEDTTCSELTTVHVESFRLLQSETRSSTKDVQTAVLFCGHLKQSSVVIGVCPSSEMTPTLQCSANELVELDTNLPPAQVINIVSSYFIPYITICEMKPNGTTVVCLSSFDDKKCLAVAHMAVELGHSTVVITKHFPQGYADNNTNTNNTNLLRFVEDEDAMTVLNTHSVGCVIGRKSYISELLQRDGGIKERLTPFATIEMLKSKEDDSSTGNLGLPVNVRVVLTSYELPMLGGFHQVGSHLKKLMNICEKPSAMHLLQQVSSRIIPLNEWKSHANFSFDEVIFSVDINESVPVNYDFSGNETKFSMNNSYIVTGGTTGFGICLVEWLVDNGAGNVVILSRSSPDSETEKKLASLRSHGSTITHIKTDITQRADVEHAFESILKDSSKPLTGIFHCAAQYDDRLIANMTPESWKNVMAVKSWGALLLHQISITSSVQLKYFVMVSSVVQMAGNIGQASYCAANTYLSSLGHYRRSQGLPATVICPGVIGDTGFAAREGLIEYWERKGMESLTAKDVMHGLDVMLSSCVSEIGISGNIQVNDFITEYRGIMKEHSNEEVGSITMGFSSERSMSSLWCDLHNTNPEETKLFILQKLCSFISNRIGLTGDISPNSSASSLGVDSLIATELSGDIQRMFFIPFPSMELIDENMTIQDLTISVYKKILAKNRPEGKENNEQEQEEDTSWKLWYLMDETVTSPKIQLICFPPNGGGPSVYAWWQGQLSKYNVQLIMAKLPGWEGRHTEKPLQNLEDIVRKLSDNLVPRLLPGRFVLFGHSIGGLIAFEVAHLLQHKGLHPAHVIVSSWYAPTLDYPNTIELSKGPLLLKQIEQNIKNNIPISNEQSQKLSFVDDAVLHNTELMKRLIPCFYVGFKICQHYRNTHKTKLQCGMTVFGAKLDRFIPLSSLDDWSQEIDPNHRFKKVIVQGGHMHITSEKKKFIRELQTTIADAFVS
ncbi:phenolphthiocerol/phthiocerol polyketide synthase subunit C-like [Antedon mediterranea]|uniref:phenolphthiocerol/phthiocerol polyketide synthase subunit C-like n=1 Tax=Antedon mediterranea TaxID=105859 RepID=UPI003AF90A5D